MNSPHLSEGTGGTDTQQQPRFSRSSPQQGLAGQTGSSMHRQTESSLSLEGYLIQAAQNNDLTEVTTWLSRAPDLDITYIVDVRKYSLLHYAAFNNQLPGAILLINHITHYLRRLGKEDADIKTDIKVWINRPTDDGFTAMHFAAYRGNVRLIEYLQSLGADITMRNRHGMNVLHISAQGDQVCQEYFLGQPISLAYFKYEGVNFSEVDVKGGTALHWAAFYGCEQATNYLLAWNVIDINKTDNEGLTPLHLGCMSGNSRVVKRLLIKGADKLRKDNKQQTAAALARENEFTNIEKMLNEKSNLLIDYYNVRPGFKKIQRTRKQLYKFGFMYLLATLAVIACLFIQQTHKTQMLIFCVAQVIVLLFFAAVCISNPGFLSRPNANQVGSIDQKPLVSLLRQNECFEVCPECEVVKPPRSKHCDICERCVGVYDHHCPWINNCVGYRNHGIFYMFILVLFMDLVYYIFLYFIFLVVDYKNIESDIDSLFFQYKKTILLILMILGLTICGIFLIPMLLLISVQTKNLMTGRTTYERYSNMSSNRMQSDVRLSASNIQGSHISYKDSLLCMKKKQSCTENCIDMCYRNRSNHEYLEDSKLPDKSLKTVDKGEGPDYII